MKTSSQNSKSSLSKIVIMLCLLGSIVAHGQTAVTLMPLPYVQFLDSSGRPLAFGCVFTYRSSTTSPLATYTDYTGAIQNPNPVPLNAAGAAGIWLQSGQAYTIAVFSNGGTNCSLGTQIESVDGIGGGLSQAVTPIPSSSSPPFVVTSQIQVFTMTLTQDSVALPVSFVGVQAPVLITFQLTQDSTGGHAFTPPPNVTGFVTVDPGANITTSQTFVWNGTSILPVGNGFTSAGNTLFASNISSANTFIALNTFSNGIAVTNGATIDVVNSPLFQGVNPTLSSTGTGASIVVGLGGNITVTPQVGANNQLARNTQFKRLFAHLGATLNSTQIVPTGWGTGVTAVTSVAGEDSAFTFTITAGATPSANPTAVVTFEDGTWTNAPICIASRGDTASTANLPWNIVTTATTATLTLIGTPTNTNVYAANVICIGQ